MKTHIKQKPGGPFRLAGQFSARMILFLVFISTSIAAYSFTGDYPVNNHGKPFNTGRIGDFVWLDMDRDGRQDAGEQGLAAITVVLLDNNGNLLATTFTDSTGHYAFSGLDTGPGGRYYEVEFRLPSGFRYSPKIGVISDPSMNSDADEFTGKSGLFLLAEGQDRRDIDAGLISTATGTLPLHTLDLTAQLQETKVTLKWVAENEMNTRQFIVQRSTDGVNFSDIGSKPMSGPINTPTQYSFINEIGSLMSYNQLYFRVKAEDNLQRFAYSNISTIRLGKITGVKIWPNPFVSDISISYNGITSGKVDVRITDQKGTVAWAGIFDTRKGINQLSVSGISNLSSGIYFIYIYDRSTNQQFVQQLTR